MRKVDTSRARAGFTLLELIVVVAMIGVLAGLVVSRIASSSDRVSIERTGRSLVANLGALRAEALRSGSSVRATLRLEGENGGGNRLVLDSDEVRPTKSWDMPGDTGARFSLDGGEHESVANVTFLPTGRSTHRECVLLSGGGAGTIFRITFDPISGEPRLESRVLSEHGGAS